MLLDHVSQWRTWRGSFFPRWYCYDSLVFFSHTLSMFPQDKDTYHHWILERKNWRHDELIGLDCLEKWINFTPSEMKDLLLRSNSARTAPRQGRVSAKSIAMLTVKSCMDKRSVGPWFLNKVSTRSIFHTFWYRGLGDLSLNTPFRRRQIQGCFPTTSPLIFLCTDEIADW